MQGTWRRVEVGGHPCDLYEPLRRNEHGQAAIYLHGIHAARLDQNEAYCAEFDRYGLPVAAPITRRSWWTDKVCAEFDPQLTAERHVLDNVLPFVEAEFGARPPGVALLGTSMGGQGGLRFAFKYPNRFPIVAAVSPAVDYQQRFFDPEEETIPLMYDDPEAARQDTATLHVHPLNWPRNIWFCSDPADEKWHDSSLKLRSKLYSLGIPHGCEFETTAGGHGWTYYNQMAPRAVGFVAERLEEERKRLVARG